MSSPHQPSSADSTTKLSVWLCSAIVESLLNGVFGLLTVETLYFWYARANIHVREGNRVSVRHRIVHVLSALFKSPLTVGSILLLAIVLAHWISAMDRLLHTVKQAVQFGPPSLIVGHKYRTIFVCLAIAIADFLLAWRLWVVSRRNKFIVLPLVVADLAFLACGIRISVQFGSASDSERDIFNPLLRPWLLTMTCLTASSNLCCSLLLSYYIHKTSSASHALANKKNILVIIVESAAIHTMLTMVDLILLIVRSPYVLLAWDNTPAMAGIAFMLINVRVALGWDVVQYGDSHNQQSRGGYPTNPAVVTVETHVSVMQDPLPHNNLDMEDSKTQYVVPGTPTRESRKFDLEAGKESIPLVLYPLQKVRRKESGSTVHASGN